MTFNLLFQIVGLGPNHRVAVSFCVGYYRRVNIVTEVSGKFSDGVDRCVCTVQWVRRVQYRLRIFMTLELSGLRFCRSLPPPPVDRLTACVDCCSSSTPRSKLALDWWSTLPRQVDHGADRIGRTWNFGSTWNFVHYTVTPVRHYQHLENDVSVK